MSALDIEPEAYDRLEALGESHALDGIPNVWDDNYWSGVLTPLPAREEGDTQVDKLDLDYLTDLYEKRERALRAGHKYETGYAVGRILEYAAQNALTNLDMLPAVRAASVRVYGDGPATGAQC